MVAAIRKRRWEAMTTIAKKRFAGGLLNRQDRLYRLRGLGVPHPQASGDPSPCLVWRAVFAATLTIRLAKAVTRGHGRG